jgi:hypothetical protein
VFDTRVLRNIFGPNTDDVTGHWSRFHNEELHELHFSPNIIRMKKSRRMRQAGHVVRMRERGAHRDFVGRHEEKKPLGKPRRRWEENINVYFQETGRRCGLN